MEEQYDTRLRKLMTIARRLADTRARVDALLDERDDEIARVLDEGVSVSSAARAAGISRQALYATFDRPEAV